MMWIKQLISEQKSVDWTVVYFFFPPFLFKAIHIFLWLQWYQQTCTATPLLLLINCVSFLQSYENYQIERAINILNRIHKLFKLEKKKRRQTIKLNIKQGGS